MKSSILALFSFACTLSVQTPVSAEIIETQEVATVLDYVSQDAVVFFNITGTLYAPSNALSDHQWREYFAERVKKITPDATIGQALIDRTKNTIVNKIPKKTVEEKTPKLIAELQDKKIVVLGLTKKQPSTSYADNFAWITQNHLTQLGIHLDKTLSYLRFRDERPFVTPYTFIYGILFTNKQPETTAFIEFLKTFQKKPSTVIVVDNTRSSLEAMEQAAQKLGMTFIGLRYGRADAAQAAFDPQLGTIEFLAYISEGKIISDSEAVQIKKENPTTNYDAQLDQYIMNHLMP